MAALPEISFVTFPMNPEANILSAKANLPNNIRDFEEFLHDNGFSRKESVIIASKGFKAIQSDSEVDEDYPRESDVESVKSSLDDFIKNLRG